MANSKHGDLKAEYDRLWAQWLELNKLGGQECDTIMQRISELHMVLGVDGGNPLGRGFKWETILDPGPNYRGPDRTPSGQRVGIRSHKSGKSEVGFQITHRAKTKLKLVT